jgi:TRAP-type C4-dicarboxylate transport system permease small subunit
MTGGAHRGPVAPTRQRRTVRFVQVLLLCIAAALFVFAGYSWGKADGFDSARRSGDLGAPSRPDAAQVIVLVVLGGAALTGALLIQATGGVRLPTPAKLDELAGRAEKTAIERAEEIASGS